MEDRSSVALEAVPDAILTNVKRSTVGGGIQNWRQSIKGQADSAFERMPPRGVICLDLRDEIVYYFPVFY